MRVWREIRTQIDRGVARLRRHIRRCLPRRGFLLRQNWQGHCTNEDTGEGRDFQHRIFPTGKRMSFNHQ
jgi:hypothetical protein